ncbi:MAG: beta-ketoacyl-[acyl-carrier-protein] synthase family protein [Ferrovum sp.]|nr:beta-ketoacyl-[acyl-carrier-protein] synthase family protein [Ferrovum sp.]
MKRVVVTGMGVISPVGHSVPVFFNALCQQQSGIQVLSHSWAKNLQSPFLAAPVQLSVEDQFTKLRRLALDRVAMLGLLAMKEAVEQAHWKTEAPKSARCGLFWGTGMGGAQTLETSYEGTFTKENYRPRPSTIVAFMSNATTGQIAIEYGIKGPSFTYSSACSSSAVAIGEAFWAIRTGRIDSAFTGGSEAVLTRGSMLAWEALQTLAKPDTEHPERSCRPFSENRSGFVLGEGAGALILESLESAEARGVPILAEIVGYGNTTDATHITQPDVDGQKRAMQEALSIARLAPQDIHYLNAHGTATRIGDIQETLSIKAAFGKYAYSLPISSTKALHGHLMGATGAVELIAALCALIQRQIPPTAFLTKADPECDLDFISEGVRACPNIQTVMSNSFGFGGNNAVLVAKRFE